LWPWGDNKMKRDQHGPRKGQGHLSWEDVARLQTEMQAHLGMRVQVRIGTHEERLKDNVLQVSVEAYDWEDQPWSKYKHRVVSLWPNTMSSTMPGLVVRLLHQLDHVAWHQAQLLPGEAQDPLGA